VYWQHGKRNLISACKGVTGVNVHWNQGYDGEAEHCVLTSTLVDPTFKHMNWRIHFLPITSIATLSYFLQ
jgi:hypothetical protein